MIKEIDKLANSVIHIQDIYLDIGNVIHILFYNKTLLMIQPNITSSVLTEIISKLTQGLNDTHLFLAGTLHRINSLKNYRNEIIGLTIRIEKYLPGLETVFLDIIAQAADLEKGNSILLIGKPASGKTTLLRNFIYTLANIHNKSVMVVDIMNEIGGYSDAPHSCFGRARRIQVTDRRMLDTKILEAVENHSPDIIVVDGIYDNNVAKVVLDIMARGVIVIATVPGYTFQSVNNNLSLIDVHNVPNKNKYGFKIAIEFTQLCEWRVHFDAEVNSNLMHKGEKIITQIRQYTGEGWNIKTDTSTYYTA